MRNTASVIGETFSPLLTQDPGGIVRIAPGELYFASIQSFKDIYGPPSKTRKLFTKGELFYDIGTPTNIVYERDPVQHAKRKERLAPGFRTQSLRDQEHVVHENVDLLMEQIACWSETSDDGADMTKALEWLTFDIMDTKMLSQPVCKDSANSKTFTRTNVRRVLRRRERRPLPPLGIRSAWVPIQL
jgi:cytochrome P450